MVHSVGTCVLIVYVMQSEPTVPGAATTAVVVKKDSTPANNHWYDVGVVKTTNMLVTHYFVPLDNSQQANGGDTVSAQFVY